MGKHKKSQLSNTRAARHIKALRKEQAAKDRDLIRAQQEISSDEHYDSVLISNNSLISVVSKTTKTHLHRGELAVKVFGRLE